MKHLIFLSALLGLAACQSPSTLNSSDQPTQDIFASEQAQFAKSIGYKDFSAQVKSMSDGNGGYHLHIQPNQPKDAKVIKAEIDDPVMKAEAGDLNQDGYPEILVFTQSVGSGSYGDVIAYSSNNGLSWSQAYFPELSDNLKQGYMGHDEFKVVENTLVRRFKTYLENDTNANPQGKTREIHYKLVDGEASRKFVVDHAYEF